MKKILALMLAAALALSLVACGGGSGEDGTTSAQLIETGLGPQFSVFLILIRVFQNGRASFS